LSSFGERGLYCSIFAHCIENGAGAFHNENYHMKEYEFGNSWSNENVIIIF